ncbi:MAG: universal stress protein [Actinomycetota bacterium]
MAYRKIIVGTDGSETAAVAVRTASHLAAATGAELLAVFAYDPASVPESRVKEVLAAMAALREAGVEPQTESREGDPPEAIIASAETHGADLIVVGDRAMGPVRRFRLGGVADHVSHYSPCDLLIVRTSDASRSPGAYQKVFVGTDGSPTASEAARRAVELAQSLGAAVTLCFVGDELTGDIVLKKTAEHLGPGQVTTQVVKGDPADKLSELAEEGGHDLVVVGNKGMSGTRKVLLGSVPDKISHYASCDVLIAKTVGRSIEDLEPGTGGVVLSEGKKVAAYRDEGGKVVAVSARCTHAGCTVGWNAAEKTWDCPCHGSRYDLEGRVINGPAENDLAKIEVGT